MVIRGCQEGKVTPRLQEVKCPKCGEIVEVFVKMGGADYFSRIGRKSKKFPKSRCKENGKAKHGE